MSDMSDHIASWMTPVEIDTVLYKNWQEQGMLLSRAFAANKTIERLEREQTKGQLMSWDQRNLDDARARLEEYKAQGAALRDEARPYEREYIRRGRWNRYYLVTNSNGHVHRGMDCTTCFDTTQYAWIVDLADCDEAKMIEEYGEKACTVCFPDAPANPHFSGPGRRDREAVEARQAEKAARQAAKQAKLLNERIKLPSVHNPQQTDYPIDTIAAAKQGIREDIYRLHSCGIPERRDILNERIRILQAALLDTGRVTRDEIETVIARAQKKAGSGSW